MPLIPGGRINLRTDDSAKLIRSRTGVNPKPPKLGQPMITLLHASNVPPMDLLSDSDVYVAAQVFDKEGAPVSEVIFWPTRDNAPFPAWNSVSILMFVNY